MKKPSRIILVILIGLLTFWLGFNYKQSEQPNEYYQVYLNDKVLGVVKSKKALEDYINKKNEFIKNKYNVEEVYAPTGLEIKKIESYQSKYDKVKDVYKKIEKESDFTVKGYRITIKGDEDDSKNIYVIDEEVYRKAVENTIRTFTGTEDYEVYYNGTQIEIETTGSYIENIYVKEDMTIKEMQIPVSEKIYIDEEELTKYLVFGTTEEQKNYTVLLGDTISTIAFNNKISVNEFLLSNSNLKSENSLLYPGQQVVIGVTNPQLNVVVEIKEVVDMVSKFQTYDRIDENRLIGDNQIIQYGEDGLIRVTQNKVVVNGEILSVVPVNRVVLKESIDQIVIKGGKYINNVGSTSSWGWPTNPGWTITSYFAYRINPINGARELHDAIDIAGTGYRSNIYAANNGTVIEASYTNVNGNYVIINHNNGYYTYYGHMDEILVKPGQIVSRGSVIGLMGETGWATGVHVHYAIWKGCKWCAVNPLWYY